VVLGLLPHAEVVDVVFAGVRVGKPQHFSAVAVLDVFVAPETLYFLHKELSAWVKIHRD
ncbi:hypothetical protein D049_2484B, partial [Vibrio parahaemolyticus VPTS-2010]